MKGGVYRMLTAITDCWLGDTMKKEINTLFTLIGKRKICNFFIGEDGNK